MSKHKMKIPSQDKEEDSGTKWASTRTNPTKNSALALTQIFKDQDINICALNDNLTDQQEKIISGDTEPLEAILISQAQTLNALFYFASERLSHSQSKEQMHAYADLSIKASNACRKTVIALHALKNPSSSIIIQEQNNLLLQQINNCLGITKNSNPENELITEAQHETLDTGRALTPSSINTTVDAVEISRCKIPGGKRNQQNE